MVAVRRVVACCSVVESVVVCCIVCCSVLQRPAFKRVMSHMKTSITLVESCLYICMGRVAYEGVISCVYESCRT